MNEVVKNMVTCSILMVTVGVGLLLMSKINFAIGCIIIGVIFAIIAIVMHIKDKD